MHAALSLILTVYVVGTRAVLSPASNVSSIELMTKSFTHFDEWKTTREQYVKIAADYPFGYPKFECPVPAAWLPPQNVHSLAPWHIQVIGAMGDSLTAGHAAASEDLMDILLDYRGLSFAIGGDETLQKRVTLPAMFSYFNPSLVGASRNVSLSSDLKLSQFNVANSGAVSSDLLRQAKELVCRIKATADVSFEKDWKFINVFIGSTDICKYCDDATLHGPEAYAANIRAALLYLRDNLPRTYVNLMPTFNFQALAEAQQNNPFCIDFQQLLCPCMEIMPPDVIAAVKKSFDAALDQFSSDEYQTETFAVAINPTISNVEKLPRKGSNLNLAFIALDCYHFSIIAHDLMGKLVWNSLFEPILTRKSLKSFDEVDPQLWVCPPQACPYLRTVGNSINCSENAVNRSPITAEADDEIAPPTSYTTMVGSSLNCSDNTIQITYFAERPMEDVIQSSLSNFRDWKTIREQYGKVNADYSFGYPKFDCSAPAEWLPPQNVHSLAPWHVKVIGAMGDSLTAGHAAASDDIVNILEEYRGVSFASGGDDKLQTRVTLPAMFSHFNPLLVGASHNVSRSNDMKLSRFNVAKSGAFITGLPKQAEELVQRIQTSNDVNFEGDWKFVNVFIGYNDLCKYCMNENRANRHGPEAYEKNIRAALLYLRDNLPRTYVNLMPTFNIQALTEARRINPFCVDFQELLCPCLDIMSSDDMAVLKKSFDDIVDQFSSDEYQTETFAVTINPTISNAEKLPHIGGNLNLAFIALDCFHFSTIAHDLVGKLVWNSLFEPIGNRKSLKSFDEVDPQLWQCPPQDCPFLRTSGNSLSCSVNSVKSADDAIAQPQLHSLSELERLAQSELSLPVLFLIFAVIFSVLVAWITCTARNRKMKVARANERTPLLHSAHIYGHVNKDQFNCP